MNKAVDWCRKRKGPALVHASVVRPYSHSMSDDERAYKPESQRTEEQKNDPLDLMAQLLVERGIETAAGIEAIQADVDQEISRATESALEAETPTADEVFDYIYSHDSDPTAPAFDTEDQGLDGDANKTMVDLLNACLQDEMTRDERIVVFGQDVADASRE